MDPLIQAHKSELLALARRYGVQGMRVFGSMARGDACPQSDVDLLLDDACGMTGFQLGALQMDLQEILGRKVDVVTLNAIHPMMRD